MTAISVPFNGWHIDADGPDAFQLTHAHYLPVRFIPSFDEACRLRKAMCHGGEEFINFVRGYERFIVTFHKRTAVGSFMQDSSDR